MKRAIAVAVFTTALLFSSCMVGPNYKRPPIDLPPTYRAPSESRPITTESLGDQKWWAVFHDKELQKLIQTALQRNYNVQIAANRVLQERAQLTITRADLFPSISGGPAITGVRSPSIPGVFRGYQYLAPELTSICILGSRFLGQVSKSD